MFHPTSIAPGTVFGGDFRVERPLAMGGMGAVYVAEQLSTGRKRALKLLLPSLIENERSRERFEQEARVASRIASDHVVEVVAAGVDATTGAPWLAMELLEGETLAARLGRTGTLSAAETLEVMRQLCHALGAAHAVSLVHRDIKPENLFLAAPRREGIPFTLKILDFGIAKFGEAIAGHGGTTGAIGSPLWMAPEQASSAPIGPPADVWALGLVVFNCLTGRHYWKTANANDATLQALLKEVMFEPLAPASARAAELGVGAWLPQGFDAWFSRVITRDPQHRYGDASHCFAGLQPVLDPHGTTLPSPPMQSASPAQSAPSAPPASSVPAGYGAPLAHAATMSAPPLTRRRPLWPWLVGVTALLLVGALVLVALGLLGLGWYTLQEEPSAALPSPTTPTTTTAPTAESTIPAPTGEPTTSPTAPTLVKRSSTPTQPTGTAVTPSPDAGNASATAPTSTTIVMSDTPAHAPRNYQLPWFNQKITQCWKGNEGAKPDAGSYSVTITVKLSELGRVDSLSVVPRTAKFFSGCATMRASEHPWGKGPPETKSFAFSF